MRNTYMLLSLTAILAVESPDARAAASCAVNTTSCNSSFCYFDCDTAGTWVRFGFITHTTSSGSTIWDGWGVCFNDLGVGSMLGTYRGHAATSYLAPLFLVRLDGGSTVSGVTDWFRFGASGSSAELCGTEGSDTYYVTGSYLGSSVPTVIVYGDKGDDHIRLAGGTLFYAAPTDAQSPDTAPWAVGGEGNDELIGSNKADRMYGGSGTDSLGDYGGDDWLYGDDGDDDYVDAGLGSDHLYGGAGSHDDLYGGDGNDYLYGDTNLNDQCHGGNPAAGSPGDTCYSSCESFDSCETRPVP